MISCVFAEISSRVWFVKRFSPSSFYSISMIHQLLGIYVEGWPTFFQVFILLWYNPLRAKGFDRCVRREKKLRISYLLFSIGIKNRLFHAISNNKLEIDLSSSSRYCFSFEDLRSKKLLKFIKFVCREIRNYLIKRRLIEENGSSV